MITLGIETSCDETAVAIIKGGCVLANVVSTQIAHSKFGGVVPELAARNHIRVIMPLTKLALETAGIGIADLDLISATRGPGLIGALLVGLAFGKSLALGLDRPFVGVNHLEGHLYTMHIENQRIRYPYLVLLVSGGHTELVLVRKEFQYETIGRTLDDACGEAFDKVAKLIGLPYPGGPYIEKAAKQGQLGAVRFPIPRVADFNFSYAGLKTAVLYYVKGNVRFKPADIAANFQESALQHLSQVTGRALKHLRIKQLGLVGGVSANKMLQHKLAQLAAEHKVKLHVPSMQYCTDNGAMIALAGSKRYKKYGRSDLNVDVVAREPLDDINK